MCVWQKWYILLFWQRRSTSSHRVLRKPHKQWGNSRPESNLFHSGLRYQLPWILFLKIFRRNIRLLLLNVQKDLCKMENRSPLSDPSVTKINYRFSFEWLFSFLSFATKKIYTYEAWWLYNQDTCVSAPVLYTVKDRCAQFSNKWEINPKHYCQVRW